MSPWKCINESVGSALILQKLRNATFELKGWAGVVRSSSAQTYELLIKLMQMIFEAHNPLLRDQWELGVVHLN